MWHWHLIDTFVIDTLVNPTSNNAKGGPVSSDDAIGKIKGWASLPVSKNEIRRSG